MKLSKKSWHVRVYEMTFPNHNLPDNLCPYFWKVVLSTILFVLVGSWYLPAYLIGVIKDSRVKEERDKERWHEEGFFSEFAGISFAINLCIYMILSMIFVWRDFKDATWAVGAILFGAVILFFIGYQIVEWRNKVKARRPVKIYNWDEPKKEPEPNILIEFIKAKYKRYCPKIEWKETNKQPTHAKE